MLVLYAARVHSNINNNNNNNNTVFICNAQIFNYTELQKHYQVTFVLAI